MPHIPASSLSHPTPPPPGRVSVASYSADEVLQNFQALYDTLDYKAELEDLGVTPMQFKRRKKALREFRALSVALWGLALQRSFPEEGPAFFARFRETSPLFSPQTGEGRMMGNRINIYVDLLAPKKDTDFLPVAQYLAEVLAPHAGDTPRMRLKLSLIMRTLYNLIFKKLV